MARIRKFDQPLCIKPVDSFNSLEKKRNKTSQVL